LSAFNLRSRIFPRFSAPGLRISFGLRPPVVGFLSALGLLLPLVLLALPALAQNTPRIGYVHPAGGRQGSSFQATVGGQSLAGVTNVHVSGGGVNCVVVAYSRPMTPKEFNELRELRDKRRATRPGTRAGQPAASTNVWTTTDEKRFAELTAQFEKNPPNRQGNPAISEVATLRVTMAANAAPGEREIRLGTPAGFSNPLRFYVGQLPEITAPPAQARPEVRRPEATANRRPAVPPTKTETRVTLPAVLNGQVMPGEVDRYRFAARQGQRLVLAASARALIPYLPDAVPGWFQATLALSDAQGNELQYADDYRFNPDPVLFYEIPRDGDYVVEIKDSIYRGREDFVYRLTVGELPFATAVFPLGAQTGATPEVEVKGWNLPAAKLTPDTSAAGVLALTVRKDDLLSNPMPFAVDPLSEAREYEPNSSVRQAQEIKTSIILNGRIDQPGDTDLFRFEGGAGDEIVAEVRARRLNSPLDSVLKLTDASGQQLAFNDDHEDKAAGLSTHHADSQLRATLPTNGVYLIQLGDTQGKGGPEYAYRLRVSPPQPDFELRLAPATLNLRAGGTVPVTVYALRQDGFTNDITLALKDAPAGFALGGAWIPGGQDQIRITLTAPPTDQAEPISLNLEGRATVQGRSLVRPVVPAEDMMQAFAYRHLVPAKELVAAVNGRSAQRVTPRILSATPVKIPLGSTARVRLGVPPRALTDRFQLELSEPPEGLTLKAVEPAGMTTELVLECDPAKAKAGLRGNLIVSASGSGAGGTNNPARPRANQRRSPQATLPAIPFEIVGAK
jgi:hypothetical protein